MSRQKHRRRKSPEVLAAQRLDEQAVRDNLKSLELRLGSFAAGLMLEKELLREDNLLRGFLGEIESRLKSTTEAAGGLTSAIIDLDFQLKDLANRLTELSEHEMRSTPPPLADIKPEEVPDDWPEKAAIEFVMAMNAEHRRTNLYNSGTPKCIDEVNTALIELGTYRDSVTSTHERLVRLARRLQRLNVATVELERQLTLRTQGAQLATIAIDQRVEHLRDSMQTHHDLVVRRDELLMQVKAKECRWRQG